MPRDESGSPSVVGGQARVAAVGRLRSGGQEQHVKDQQGQPKGEGAGTARRRGHLDYRGILVQIFKDCVDHLTDKFAQ